MLVDQMLVYSAYWVVCRIQAWVTILVVPTYGYSKY